MGDDWHPATISRRGKRLYAKMTIPTWARGSFDQTQIALSAQTSDCRTAYERLNDLELKLRDKVLQRVGRDRLTAPESALSRLLKALHQTEFIYTMRYDPQWDDNFEITFSEAPTSDREVEHAIATLQHLCKEFEQSLENRRYYIEWFEKHSCPPPDLENIQRLLVVAVDELQQLHSAPRTNIITATDYLKVFQQHLQNRVSNGHLKIKTSKARLKNIKRFIEVVGSKPLADITKADAYRYADTLSREHGNSTIKTRVSDVSTMLNQAERDGLISTNPFIGLKLSDYGKKKESYAPLSDLQIKALLNIPNLPGRIRDVWIILAGTGMRLDEAALMTAGQVKIEQGIRYFDLRAADVKNTASRRRIPISIALNATVEELCRGKAPSDRLFEFPLKLDGKSRASEQCNYWMKKAFAADPDIFKGGHFTTHSLRGSFKDKLRDAGVDSEVNNAILGHDLGGVASSYGRGPSLEMMKQAVDKTKHSYLTAT